MRAVYFLLALMALWLITPTLASAQVTVSQVRVTIAGTGKTAVYCDAFTAITDSACQVVWTLPGVSHSITLAPNETLLLTQTGISPGSANAGNFDTSDRFTGANSEVDCNLDCKVTIELNTGVTLTTVYGPILCDALDNCNQDPGGPSHTEGTQFQTLPAATGTGFELRTGYADNVHNQSNVFLPTPWVGGVTNSAGAAGLGAEGTCPNSTPGGCYDAGAILITGVTAPALQTVTQGGWGAPAHGQNPGTILNAYFAAHPSASFLIGTAACRSVVFTSADQIRAFLPQGGAPAQLSTTGKKTVLAGQVLALTLNVGILGNGLGSQVLFTTGPAANKTVNQILADANTALGCGTFAGYSSISQLNDIVDFINNKYD